MQGWFSGRCRMLLVALLMLAFKVTNAYGLASIGVAEVPGSGAEQDLAGMLSVAVTGRLTQTGWYKLVERNEIANALQQCGSYDDVKCLVKAGTELKLDKLALVSARKLRGNVDGNYEVAVRVININRGEEETRQQAECKDNPKLKGCILKLVEDTLKGISVQAEVTQADDEQITINFGKNAGLTEGKALKIIRIKRVTASGGSRTLFTGEKIIGEARIQSVSEQESQLRVIRSFMPIKAGDIAMLSGVVLPKSKEDIELPSMGRHKEEEKPEPAPPVAEAPAPEPAEAAHVEEPAPEPTPVAESVPSLAQELKAAVAEAAAAALAAEPKPAVEIAAAEPAPEPQAAPAAPEDVKAEEPAASQPGVKEPEAAPEKPAPQEAAKKPAVQEVAQNGVLNIISDPDGAEIFLNGESMGNTPKLIPNLSPGEYKIKLEKEFCEDWQGKARIVAGQTNKLEIALKENVGKLTITSIPSGADITIEGKESGKTNATLKLLPAQYTISVGKKGYRKESKTIQLNNNEVQMVDFVLLKDEHVQIPDMVYVPEGSFHMGYANGGSEEAPVHDVYLDAFYIDKYAVSNKDYQKFMKETKHREPNFWTDGDLNKPDYPVVGVSWSDAQAYCKWAGKRLPTEAEWEKAARGVDSRLYPWGNTFDFHRANSYGDQDGYKFTAPVNSMPGGQSMFGALHMSGNVWQWCSDWYDPDYYHKSPAKNPAGPAQGEFRVLRGDAWDEGNTANLRVTHRFGKAPNNATYNTGFRCAK